MPERVTGASVSEDFLATLGVLPAVGRDFAAGEDRVAIVTSEFCERQLGPPASAIGRVVMLNGGPYTVAGVMRSGFRFPGEIHADVLVPAGLGAMPDFAAKTVGGLRGIGRLRPGV